MRLFRGLFGGTRERANGPLPDLLEASDVLVLGGSLTLEVVGESHYVDNLRLIVSTARERAALEVIGVLHTETDNHYDPNAVSIWVNQLQVGYLSRENAVRYRPGIERLQQVHGRPIGLRGDIVGDEFLGVFLRHDPRDFGLEAPDPRIHSGEMRTGLSDALATDATDDSYDLGWVLTLPSDSVARVMRLKELLRDEHDPIDRHFMFHELESALYRSRNAVPSALLEFDDVCRQHDAEIETLRGAFIRKWGRIPVLEMYRQMSIRESKAHNFPQALWWAERGLAVYGSDAARVESVEDLRDRAEKYRLAVAPHEGRQRSVTPRTTTTGMAETLTCTRCAKTFERLRLRGRKPTLCPTCRIATGTVN